MRAAFQGENRRALIFGSIGLAVVLVAVLAHALAGGGGASNPAATAPSTIPANPAPGAPGGVTPTTAAGQVPPSAQVFTSKDPFTPLASATTGSGTSGSAAAPSGATGSSGPSGSGTTGTASSAGTTGGTGGSTGGGANTPSGAGGTSSGSSASGSAGASGAGSGAGASTSPNRGQAFQLMDVYASGAHSLASVQVEDSLYQVGPGQSFAGNYTVIDLSLSTQCGDFSHGGVQFHLCKGSQVLK